jgi:hypothetical protein
MLGTWLKEVGACLSKHETVSSSFSITKKEKRRRKAARISMVLSK